MPGSLLSTLYILAHLILITAYEIYIIIIPILQKRNKVKQRLNNFPKVILTVEIRTKI